MKNVEIKQVTSIDIPVLLPLIHEYWKFENIGNFDSERIEKQLNRLISEPDRGSCWVAIEESVAAGYLLAVYVFSLEHMGITAEIDEFFILPQYRGQGIGTSLIQTAELQFRDAGCTNVSLQIKRNNHPAHLFYNHQGYVKRSQYELLEKQIPH